MPQEFVNSENERIAIEDRKLRGAPVKCLVLYDDFWPKGSGRPAPMLLDSGTIQWLRKQLEELDAKTRIPNAGT